MQLSVSCRIAEGFLSKEEASMSLAELADLAVASGYDALCMRASQIGIQSSADEAKAARELLEERNLPVSMLTGDFDIVYNNDQGPNCLRNVKPYLDLAETLGAPMLRMCLKQDADLQAAQQAADAAADRGLTLVHQCHTLSLFETLDGIVNSLEQIDRPNFGLIFEAANLELCGQEYGPDAVQRLAPWIRNVYLQNQQVHPAGAVTLDTWCRGPESFDITPIHQAGGIDFASVFAGCHAIGYDGPVTVHQSAPEDGQTTPAEMATETARYLRELWASTAT